MFKLRRKSQKKAQKKEYQLTGMPALKQKRSSKREETLAAKMMALEQNSSLSKDFNRLDLQTNGHQTEHTSHIRASPEFHNIEDCTAYKPVDSTKGLDCGVDFDENEGEDHRESLHFYDEVMQSISEDVIGDEDDYGRNAEWKLTNGDSGYKSLDGTCMNEGKVEWNKIKEETHPKGKVLHAVKKQRKASREDNVRNSLRALTPRERESIMCLEEVLKYHSDGDESVDEVFDGRTSQVELDADVFLNYNCTDEPMDGARRGSVDSLSSVGSIIDLVGNLSEVSPQVSPTKYSTPNHILTSIDDSVLPSDNHEIDSQNENLVVDEPLAMDLSDFTELHGSMELSKGKKSTATMSSDDKWSTENRENKMAAEKIKDNKREAEEPIYAQVNKPKKKVAPEAEATKKEVMVNENDALKGRDTTNIEIENLPPSPMHVNESVRTNPSCISSPTKTNCRFQQQEFSNQKTSTPWFDSNFERSVGRLFVEKHISENALRESALGLRHVERSSSRNKVFQVEPAKHRKVDITEIKKEEEKVGNKMETNAKSVNNYPPNKLDSNKNLVAKRVSSFNDSPTSYKDKNGNLRWAMQEQKHSRFVIRPYSSFKMDKSESNYVKKEPLNRLSPRVTPKPFIIRPAAQKVELY